MPKDSIDVTMHITLSGDVYLKSHRTQRRMIRQLVSNLEVALTRVQTGLQLKRIGSHRFELHVPADILADVQQAVLGVFGISAIEIMEELEFTTIDDLAESVRGCVSDSVAGNTFAARVKRRGSHDWSSVDLARRIGDALFDVSAGVDLTDPAVEVVVTVLDDRAFLVTDRQKGAGGLPLGTQETVLCLVSGGFDSVVAAWMLMSRGCPIDFVHFSLNCAQSDHALAVARELWRKWGHGTEPKVHLVEFQPVKDALLEHVDARMRQVALKVMMAEAASSIASAENITALVTGDALGQVSSQTLPHLVAVSNATSTPIFRPLLGLPKESIIDLARMVGTAELSARAQEVCDLSAGGPVATAASELSISNTVSRIPHHVLEDVVATRKTFDLRDWVPGQM